MKPWLVPTCLCMCLSILSAPPAEPARWMQFLWLLQLPGREEQLDAGAGRTDVSLWISQKLDRECAGATKRRREGTQEKALCLLGAGVAPNRLSSEQAPTQRGGGKK